MGQCSEGRIGKSVTHLSIISCVTVHLHDDGNCAQKKV